MVEVIEVTDLVVGLPGGRAVEGDHPVSGDRPLHPHRSIL